MIKTQDHTATWKAIGGFVNRGMPPHVGLHTPDETMTADQTTSSMKVLCRYCEDDREAYRIKSAWFHIVARGEAGQYEICDAAKLRQAVVDGKL